MTNQKKMMNNDDDEERHNAEMNNDDAAEMDLILGDQPSRKNLNCKSMNSRGQFIPINLDDNDDNGDDNIGTLQCVKMQKLIINLDC